jgi:hypothetical protein
VQELLAGMKGRQLGKHPSISCGPNGRIDCHSSSYWR